MHRVIDGLRWSAARESGPFGEAKTRARGAKAAGLRYERELAAALPQAKHGQWFEFIDRHGKGWCQTDLLSQIGDVMIVFEAKNTWVPEGHSQIDLLYRPVVGAAYGCKVYGVVVCKHLIPGMNARVVGDLESALRLAITGTPRVVLHWLGGKGSLVPRNAPLPRLSPAQSALFA